LEESPRAWDELHGADCVVPQRVPVMAPAVGIANGGNRADAIENRPNDPGGVSVSVNLPATGVT
jgi:hypothetical protein